MPGGGGGARPLRPPKSATDVSESALGRVVVELQEVLNESPEQECLSALCRAIFKVGVYLYL